MRLPKALPVPDRRESWEVLDSTKIQCASRCLRRYFYEYVLGWRSDAPSNHLVFGSAWHAALEHLYKHQLNPEEIPEAYRLFLGEYREEFPNTTDDWFKGKSPRAAGEALIEYCETYASDAIKFKVLATEVGGLVPIGPERLIALKMDLVAEDRHGIFGVEHKTGSVAGRTWDLQWDLSIQIGTYLHGLLASFIEDRDTQSRILINGTFFYKDKRAFKRIPCTRAGWSMLNWLDVVNHQYDMIEYEFEKLSQADPSDTVLNAFLMNPISCTDYGGCSFHDLCVGVPNPLKYAFNQYPPSGFKHYWWDPLKEVKENVEFRTLS